MHHGFVLVRIRLTRTVAERGPVLSGVCGQGSGFHNRWHQCAFPRATEKLGTGVNGNFLAVAPMAVAVDEGRRALVRGWGCWAGEHWEQGAGDLFAEFDAPLVETVDVPDGTSREC